MLLLCLVQHPELLSLGPVLLLERLRLLIYALVRAHDLLRKLRRPRIEVTRDQ